MDLSDRLSSRDVNARKRREEHERVCSDVRSIRPITKTRLALSFIKFERRLARVRKGRTDLWEASADLRFAATTWISGIRNLDNETAECFRALVHFSGTGVLLICSVVEAAWAALALIVLRP